MTGATTGSLTAAAGAAEGPVVSAGAGSATGAGAISAMGAAAGVAAGWEEAAGVCKLLGAGESGEEVLLDSTEGTSAAGNAMAGVGGT